MMDFTQCSCSSYDFGYSDGYADGYDEATKASEDQAKKLYSELVILEARIDYLEKQFGLKHD